MGTFLATLRGAFGLSQNIKTAATEPGGGPAIMPVATRESGSGRASEAWFAMG